MKKTDNSLQAKIARTNKLVSGKRPAGKTTNTPSKSKKTPKQPDKKVRKSKVEKKTSTGKLSLEQIETELKALKKKTGKEAFLRKMELGRMRKQMKGSK